YGEWSGVRIARKHVGWYFQTQPDGARMRHLFNRLDTPDTQLDLIHQYFARVSEAKEKYQAA
ncbi:MAG: tRNA dihydrouridine synthase DusB, partial [Natronospirillum sp.]